jgi:hypothetical protein
MSNDSTNGRALSRSANSNGELSTETASRQDAIAKFLDGEYTDIGQRVATYEGRHRNLFQRWFTERGMADLLEQQRLQEITAFHEFRREAFKLACDTRLEIAHEGCLRMVREAKVGDRERFSAFVMAKQRELRSTVHRERESFMDDIDRQYAMVERFAHRPSAAAKALDSVESEVIRYFTWMDDLVVWFMNVAKEKVNQYRIAE